MWCIVFSLYIGSFWVMGASMLGHALLPAAIVVTVGTFETAKRKPSFFVDFPLQLQVVQGHFGLVVREYTDPYGGEHE